MGTFYSFFSKRRRGLLRVLTSLIVLIAVVAPFQLTPTSAAGNSCRTSNPSSRAYTVQVCITGPADGATVGGSSSVAATVTTTGSPPSVAKLIFYLAGQYLITDYQSPYTFVLPTTKWVDGSRSLQVEVIMRDGFTSQRASITLNFSNGIVQPPVNNDVFTVRTGTTPPAGQAFVVAATGDGADGATDSASITNLIASWNPNLFLYLGDVYDRGTSTEFHNWYGLSNAFFGRFYSITNPIVGNHEYLSGSTAPGYFDYWDNVPRYYSYDAAGWHFIALESNCGTAGICNPGQAEYEWLKNDLNVHRSTCTIAYFHHPVYTVGPRGSATQMTDIWALLATSGVDIVLTGHDHSYQRWKPLNAVGAVSAAGVTEFVAGGGGHGIQRFVRRDSRLTVGFDTSSTAYGALRLQLNQHGAGFQYINNARTMIDSGSVLCSGAPADTTAPGVPTNLRATARASRLVNLTWTPAVDNVGVTGYSIYRNGSLLSTIGPQTSYDDATVQPNLTYSYQIRARDAVGNLSGLSNGATTVTPDPATSIWYVAGVGTFPFGLGGDIPVPSDYNGDGKADIAVFRPSTGTWYIDGIAVALFGGSGDIPVVADYSGDGIADLAVFRPSISTWYVNGYGTFSFGTVNDIPVVADYNGDAKADIAVFRPSTGTWYVRGVGSFRFGTARDMPVVADYNGDGKADIAVFRPATNSWHIRGIGVFLFGTVNDTPVVADYNADGKADIAVFRPSNGTWYVRGIGKFSFGKDGDIPVVADYNGDGRADLAVWRPPSN